MSPGQEPPDVDTILGELDELSLDGFELLINPDGSVTFIDFPSELLDVAYALNPDDPLVCERRAQRSQSRENSESN